MEKQLKAEGKPVPRWVTERLRLQKHCAKGTTDDKDANTPIS